MSESFDQCPTISDVETEDEDEWDDPPLVLLDSEFAPLPAIPIIMAMMKIPHVILGLTLGITTPFLSLNFPMRIITMSINHQIPKPPNVTSWATPDLILPV